MSSQYLMQPYLSQDPYLAEGGPSGRGVQFEANAGAFFKSSGVQGLLEGTTNKAKGSQFEVFTRKSYGAQFDFAILNRTGVQFEASIYNTTQLRYMYQFESRGITGENWTASTTAPSSTDSFSVNNLNTDITEQVWRSADLSVQTLQCDTEKAEGVYLDTFALINHNLTPGASVTITGSNDVAFNNIGFVQNLEYTEDDLFFISPLKPIEAFRYYKITVEDVANPDGYIQFGTIIFGEAIVFTSDENFTDKVSYGKVQFQDSIKTEGFTNVMNDRGQKKYLDLSFKNLRADNGNYPGFKEMLSYSGSILKILLIPIPTNPSALGIFAKLKALPKEDHKYMGDHYVSFSISLDESR